MLYLIMLLTATTIGCGIHAFYIHTLEMGNMVSSQRWVCWVYSGVFLVMSAFNAVVLCVALVSSETKEFILQLTYGSLVLIMSYAITLAGMRAKIRK